MWSHAFEAVSCCMGVWQWLAAVARRGATRAKAGWLQKVKLQVIHPCLEGDFPTFLSEFGGGDCRWDFLMIFLDFWLNHLPVDAVDSVCPQGPTAVGKSDTAVELAKQLQLQGRKANRLRRWDWSAVDWNLGQVRLISADSVQVYKGSECRSHENDIEIGVFSTWVTWVTSVLIITSSPFTLFFQINLFRSCRVAGLDIGSNKPSPEEQDRYQKARSK